MNLTYQERQELNELSKKVFGTTSRWQKIVNDGVAEPMEREREVLVPKANGQLVKKIFTDKKAVIKHYSVEEVKKLMEDILTARKATVAVPGPDALNATIPDTK
jgi:hypothetical protein